MDAADAAAAGCCAISVAGRSHDEQRCGSCFRPAPVAAGCTRQVVGKTLRLFVVAVADGADWRRATSERCPDLAA